MIPYIFQTIFYFYTGLYLWKRTEDGKLINDILEDKWLYGNKKIFFATTAKMNHNSRCSACEGICFLAYT